MSAWRALPSDEGAPFDREIRLDGSEIEPMITFGTHPGMVIPISAPIPTLANDPVYDKALAYMGFSAGAPIRDQAIDVVFIGSCTNGRLSDLRGAADILRGHKVAKGVQLLVVPGSQQVKRAAEAEGLDRVFIEAGGDWRESGCSMCIGMNGDNVGARAIVGEHQQPKFRRPPGTRRANPARQPAHRRGQRRARPRHRSA